MSKGNAVRLHMQRTCYINGTIVLYFHFAQEMNPVHYIPVEQVCSQRQYGV